MNDYKIRSYFILGGFGFIFLIYSVRLFYVQVMSPGYRQKADVRDIKERELIPSRGLVFDRNENIIVKNTPVFDIEFVPKEIKISDTTILTRYLGLSAEQIRKTIMEGREGKNAEPYKEKILKKQVSNETFNQLSEHLYQFEGIYPKARPTREYPYHNGGLFLGYINEVSQKDLDKAANDEDVYYKKGDLTGITGVERMYEKKLRGVKGKKTVLRDTHGREIGPYADGALDQQPEPGSDIKIGVDVDLQALGEKLMAGKRGSIVAIEPATGEILAFISSPGYDPGLLSGDKIGQNYLMLARDSLLPLYNRPLQAQYSPGSIFKMVQALAALGDSIIFEGTHFSCGGAWGRNGGKPKCHGAHGACSLHDAIVHSCNAYFAELYYTFLNHPRYHGDIHKAYDRWHTVMNMYGIGRTLEIDIPNENKGNVPPGEYYDKRYGPNGWGALTIYSNSIGQGEILMTPLQMANLAAIIANRGYYYKPHFARAWRDTTGEWRNFDYERVVLPGAASNFEIVVNGMDDVVRSGTGTMARLDSIVVCGKTGTVENPPYPDHSVFICFAPKENPKIAVAVIVENAGWGGSWAAPISALMIEQYLNHKIKDQYKVDRILKAHYSRDKGLVVGGETPVPAPILQGDD